MVDVRPDLGKQHLEMVVLAVDDGPAAFVRDQGPPAKLALVKPEDSFVAPSFVEQAFRQNEHRGGMLVLDVLYQSVEWLPRGLCGGGVDRRGTEWRGSVRGQTGRRRCKPETDGTDHGCKSHIDPFQRFRPFHDHHGTHAPRMSAASALGPAIQAIHYSGSQSAASNLAESRSEKPALRKMKPAFKMLYHKNPERRRGQGGARRLSERARTDGDTRHPGTTL